MSRFARFAAPLAGLALLLAACSGDDDSGSAETDVAATVATSAPTTTAPTTTVAPSTTAPPESLRIMVTNDDGVAAPGIDTLVQALQRMEGVEVTVIAPAANQSGTGESTTPGALASAAATTASGIEATAVDGFPADTVIAAFEQGLLPEKPDLVVSGINQGQNIGPFVDISGTVGAAKAAVRRGVPALAVSQGVLTDGSAEPDYPTAARLVVEWIEANRQAILDGTAPILVTNLNVPTCPTGSLRGTSEEPVATDFANRDIAAVDCTSQLTDFADDVAAFVAGYAPISTIVPS